MRTSLDRKMMDLVTWYAVFSLLGYICYKRLGYLHSILTECHLIILSYMETEGCKSFRKTACEVFGY
jgi:hypothetical protein